MLMLDPFDKEAVKTDPASTKILTGVNAIEHAETNGLLVNKYADPVEGPREALTVEEAREVATEDPGLIWMQVEDPEPDGTVTLGLEAR